MRLLQWVLGTIPSSKIVSGTFSFPRYVGSRITSISVHASSLEEAILEIFRNIWRFAGLTSQIFCAVLVSLLLQAFIPICGREAREPLHFLPHFNEATAHVDVSCTWAATLAPDIVVDVIFELKLPNTDRNVEAFSGWARLDLEFDNLNISRPLVLPRISSRARQMQDLFLSLPMAFGLVYDEHAVVMTLASGVAPDDCCGGVSVRLAPSLLVREAELRLLPRWAGPVGRILSQPVMFVPACALFLIFTWRRRTAEASSENLCYVERVMLTKALCGAHPEPHFLTVDAAFEVEDRRTHAGSCRGCVPIVALGKIISIGRDELVNVFDENQLLEIVEATQQLQPASNGLVTPGECLSYRKWIAVVTVMLLTGSTDIAKFQKYLLEHHHDEGHAGGGNFLRNLPKGRMIINQLRRVLQ